MEALHTRHDPDCLQNPYESLYRANCPLPLSDRRQAENVARHLGLMHNAFGNILKDLVFLLAHRFPQDRPPQEDPQPMEEEPPRPHPQPPPDQRTDLQLFRERLSRIVEDVKKTKKKKDRKKEERSSASPRRQLEEPSSQIEAREAPSQEI
jgi:hypothetical protein